MPKIFEKEEDVPEDFRQFLKKTEDGKFELESIGGLKSALEAVKRERDGLKPTAKEVEAFKKLGKTPEEIAQILQTMQEEENKKAEKAGEWDKLKQQLTTAHQSELEKYKTEIDRYKNSFFTSMIESQATSALAEEKGVPTLLMPHIKAMTRVVEEDGKFILEVVGQDGKRRYNDKGEVFTIKDLVKEMKKSTEFGRAFDGNNNSGGGASGGSKGAGGGPGGKKRSQMSTVEKAAYIREHGQEAFMQLPR